MPMPRNTPEQFWSLVNKKKSGDCWEWLGNKNKKGYGQFSLILLGVTYHLTHRISWVLHTNVPVYQEDHILHKCDNPACVNPKHLFLGNNQENIWDSIKKNNRISSKIITKADVLIIKKLREESDLTCREIGKILNIHYSTVGRIANGQRRNKWTR